MTCIFCDTDKIQKRITYKDDLVIAFPTNIPIVPGHILVCPLRHVTFIDELTDKELIAIRKFIVRLKVALKSTFQAEGFNIAWNEGEVAGQSIMHLHIHVIPRKKGDTGILEYDPRKFIYRPGSRDISPDQELQDVSDLIKKSLV